MNEEGDSRGKKMITLKSNFVYDVFDFEDDEEDDKEIALTVKKFCKVTRK